MRRLVTLLTVFMQLPKSERMPRFDSVVRRPVHMEV